jgi:hypothetical protein
MQAPPNNSASGLPPCTSCTRTSMNETFRHLSTSSSAGPGLPPAPETRRLGLEPRHPNLPPLALRRHHQSTPNPTRISPCPQAPLSPQTRQTPKPAMPLDRKRPGPPSSTGIPSVSPLGLPRAFAIHRGACPGTATRLQPSNPVLPSPFFSTSVGSPCSGWVPPARGWVSGSPRFARPRPARSVQSDSRFLGVNHA